MTEKLKKIESLFDELCQSGCKKGNNGVYARNGFSVRKRVDDDLVDLDLRGLTVDDVRNVLGVLGDRK